MERSWFGMPQVPQRLPSGWAKGLLGLSLFVLALGGLGLFLYDGWHRVAYATAFAAMGLGNLAWAVGSLLPEGRGSFLARLAVVQLATVMLFALGAALAFQFGRGS